MKKALGIVSAVIVFAAAGLSAQANITAGHPGQNLGGKTIGRPAGIVGTVIYDTGAPDRISPTSGSLLVGNRFDTNNGNPLIPGTIYQFTFWASAGHFPGQLLFLHGPPVGGYAPTLGSVFASGGITGSAFNAFAFAPLSVGASFLGDVFVDGGWGGVGIDSDTTQGQGYHGFYGTIINSNPYPLTGYRALPQNTLLRITGDILVPVELMQFEVE